MARRLLFTYAGRSLFRTEYAPIAIAAIGDSTGGPYRLGVERTTLGLSSNAIGEVELERQCS